MIKKLLILSLVVTIILAGAGTEVQCNTNDQSACGGAGGSSWTTGSTTGKSKISDCSSIGTLTSLNNVYDTLCSSCPGSPANSYATSGKNGCQVSVATPGAPVACQKTGTICSTCGTIPPSFTWAPATKSDTTNCIITSCLAGPMPTSNLIDNFCTSCGGSNTFANTDSTACVGSKASCSTTTRGSTAWTDADCNACNTGSATQASNIFSNTDNTACVGSKATCTNRKAPWTDADCNACNTGSATQASNIFSNTDNTACVGSKATCQTNRKAPWTDVDCKACNTGSTTQGQNLFTNTDGSACVASSATCQTSRTSGWTDLDCNTCNQNTATPSMIYAKSDQSGCQANVAVQGTNVPCQSSNLCSSCGSFTNFQFIAPKSDTQNCQIKSCLAAPMPKANLNDNFCGSCGQANKFANSYGTSCVNSTGTCSRSSGWTDSDCSACNASGANSGNQYASADQKSCVSTKPSTSPTSPTSTFSSIIAFLGLIVISLFI